MQSSRCDRRYRALWNEMNPLKTDLSLQARGTSIGWTTRKISTSQWSVNGPIDTKARIKRRWLFHLRAEISFAHLGTCRRRHRRSPSARRERAQIERILTSTLKRKRFTVALDELTATRSIITIRYRIIAITRCLLTNWIFLAPLSTVHAGCTLSSLIVVCSKL